MAERQKETHVRQISAFENEVVPGRRRWHIVQRGAEAGQEGIVTRIEAVRKQKVPERLYVERSFRRSLSILFT